MHTELSNVKAENQELRSRITANTSDTQPAAQDLSRAKRDTPPNIRVEEIGKLKAGPGMQSWIINAESSVSEQVTGRKHWLN